MKIETSYTEGETVILTVDDQLDDVPDSHRGLLTPCLREAFDDPPEYFRAIAKECPFNEMKCWLREAAESGDWQVELHKHGWDDRTSAGFIWTNLERYARVTIAEYEPPEWIPKAMATYYSLIDMLAMDDYGMAGYFCAADDLGLLSPHIGIVTPDENIGVDPEETVVWGCSPCGDMMIFTSDGQAGWYEHGERRVEFLGSCEDAIEWIFGRLRRGELPYLR